MVSSGVATGQVVLFSRLWADASESAKSWASLSVVVVVVVIMVVAVANRASALIDVRVGI